MENMQVYKLFPAEAKARGEIDIFRASRKLNIACKEAIEAAIRENFDGMHLKEECIRPVMEEYGSDRMDWVLANTVRYLNYDGRFSHSNKKWADSYLSQEGGIQNYDTVCDYIVGSHPAVLDGFISLMRRDREAAKSQSEKPSIREQLAAPPVPGEKHDHKTNDREVR